MTTVFEFQQHVLSALQRC